MAKVKYNKNSVYVFEGPCSNSRNRTAKEIVIVDFFSDSYSVIFSTGNQLSTSKGTPFILEFEEKGRVKDYKIIQEWK